MMLSNVYAGESFTVATPLLREEVNDALDQNNFDPESIFKRLKQTGDPFENLFKKRINGAELIQRLEENYGFLF
jgi:DNA primase